MEPPGSQALPPVVPSRPVEGLLIQAVPSCGHPEFSLDHLYFEQVYGPVIGPAAVMVLRNLARHLVGTEGIVKVCPIEISLETGLRASRDEPVGRNSGLMKTISRLERYRLVRPLDDDILGVLVAVPPIPDRWLEQVPSTALAAHRQFLHGADGR